MDANEQLQRIQQRKAEGFTVQLKLAGYDDDTIRRVLPAYEQLDQARTRKAEAIRSTILGVKAA